MDKILSLSLSQLVSQSTSGSLPPSLVLQAYSHTALLAHKSTNCLALSLHNPLSTPAIANHSGLLLAVPVSIKDTIDIQGHDTTIGFLHNRGHPKPSSSAIVRLLQDAGAIIHAKTTVPTALLAIETVSSLFGTTTNPHNPAYSVGASTGGGAALLACGGTKIEIGTDLAGSVRLPAHFCGVWSLKGSHGRFPTWGSHSSMEGLESIPIVAAPMAANLDDLHQFWKRVVDCEPWKYDHTCIPLPWRDINLQDEGRKLKWGVIWEDGTIPPTPACKRALSTVISALQKQGHEVVDFNPPDVLEGLQIGYQLLFADGGHQIRTNLSPNDTLTSAAQSILNLLNLPKLLKRLLSYLTRTTDPLTSKLYGVMHTKTVVEERELVVARDKYRAAWHDKWIEEGLDFVLTVPFALPALANGDSEKTTLICVGYTFLFSILDYAAGILPVTYVDKNQDKLPSNLSSSLSKIAQTAYTAYDAERMHGLPLGVQVVGRRFEEEKVLQGMAIVEKALGEQRVVYVNKARVF